MDFNPYQSPDTFNSGSKGSPAWRYILLVAICAAASPFAIVAMFTGSMTLMALFDAQLIPAGVLFVVTLCALAMTGLLAYVARRCVP